MKRMGISSWGRGGDGGGRNCRSSVWVCIKEGSECWSEESALWREGRFILYALGSRGREVRVLKEVLGGKALPSLGLPGPPGRDSAL